MQIIIPINPVTKKNHGRIVKKKTKYGKTIPIMLPSEAYEKYQKECKQYMPKLDKPIDYPINLKCTFYMQTHRKVDLSNLISAISDILTEYKVIIDDNRNIIASYDGSIVLYDKVNPRTEVEITKRNDYIQW